MVFYSLVTFGSKDQDFAGKRQLFLTEQGYAYEILEVGPDGLPSLPGATASEMGSPSGPSNRSKNDGEPGSQEARGGAQHRPHSPDLPASTTDSVEA